MAAATPGIGAFLDNWTTLTCPPRVQVLEASRPGATLLRTTSTRLVASYVTCVHVCASRHNRRSAPLFCLRQNNSGHTVCSPVWLRPQVSLE
eukprot:3177412-Prorocentrum_lima.AAC.1